MDQDVEAILNASDSEGDENLNVHGVSLEDILREDDGGEEYLDGESGGIGDLRGGIPRLDSDLPDLDFLRWTTAGGDVSPPMAYRSPIDTGRGELSPGGGFQGLGVEGDQAGVVGTGSNPAGNIAGLGDVDGYDAVLGGGPPRTAFLSREELSEDSRLLQQILKENDDDVAASSADRSKMLLSGAGGGSRSSFSVSGGSARDLYACDGFLAGVGDGDGGFDALQTLDVDKIIQSIEDETEIEKQEQSLGAPWRTRLRSRGGAGMSSVGVAEPGIGTAGEMLGWGDGRHTRDLQQFHGGRGSFGARGGAGDAGGLAEGLVSLGNGGEAIPPTASLKAKGNLESGVSRRRHVSPGKRVGALAAVAAAPGEVRGGVGGGDGGVMSPLAKAESAELRLLRGGNREMISPLQVKRRMRVPNPGSSSGQGSTTSGFPSSVGGGGVGVVRMENLDAASRQLARNAAYGKHGPGVCTAAGAHPKFIAVGTSRGLILLFDHFQEIRHVLGSAAGTGPDGIPSDDPVTSLDMCVGCDCLVAGHGSGRVLLWDFLRGVVLRAVADVHSSAVVSVRCFAPGGGGGGGFGVGGVGGVGGALGAVAGGGAEPAAITADMEGVVNKLCFRRVMWSKWVVDTECLLDGAAGPIPALCVLPNWMDTSSSGGMSSGSGGMGIKVGGGGIPSPGFHDIGLMAMSSWKNTFIVGIYPDVKVIHKWSRPLLPGAAEHLPCPCLSWGPPQPSTARPKAPAMALLARGWGNSIQIMAATRIDAGGGDGGVVSIPGLGRSGAGTGAIWPRLEVVKELSASAAVVAVEWLQEQVLAYLDAEMELCVLDTRAGAELEHASLVSLGVAISPLLPPPPSSQPSTAVVSRGDPREETPEGGGRPEGEPGEGGHSSPVRHASLSLPPKGTYHNAFRACQGRLYLLGSQELRAVRVQGWSQRVDSLVQAGEWLEALAVALDHYEQKILPAEIAAASTVLESKVDVGEGTVVGHAEGNFRGNSTGLDESRRGAPGEGDYRTQQQFHIQQQHRLAPRSEAAEHINDLLAQYLRLAVNNAPAADPPSTSSHGDNDGSRINLAHSHFQMLAGVCTEFCAVTGRLDMLFGPVFHAFRTRGHQGVFLDTLEPCVLAGKLTMLSPELLGAFVDRCQSAGDMITAERLVLRLDPRSIDLSSTLPLLRMHCLHTALLAVRALRGDYVTSPEEVLQEVIAIADRDQSAVRRGPPSNKGGVAVDWEIGADTDLYPYPADPKFEELGNKILLYIKRCFKGQVLGSSVSLTGAETARARAGLLALLMRQTLFTGEEGREAGVVKRGGGNPGTGKKSRRSRWWHASFPYLSILLYVDPAATLDVLSIAMDSPEAVFREEESGDNYLPSPGGVAASGGDAVPVSVARARSTSSMSDSSGRGLQYGGRGPGGGVGGRRLGRGRARAIGWTAGGSGGDRARAEKEGRGGRGGEGDGGRAMIGFSGETTEPSEVFAGRGGGGVESSDGAARCPSRRSIIEAVTRVLAPYLSDCAEADLLGEGGGEEDEARGEAGSDLSEEDGVGMVSAAAFVHDTRGSLASESVSQEGKAAGAEKDGVLQLGGPPGSKSGAKVPSSRVRDRDGQEWWGAARPHLLDFVAKYLELSLVMVGPKLINAVLVSVAMRNGDTVEEGSVAARQAQARLVTLLQRVPLSLVDRGTLLPLAERNKYFRAAVILLRATVSLGEERGFRLEQFSRIVRCYLLGADDSFRSQVFGFIRQEVGVAVANVTLPSTTGDDEAADAGDVGVEEDKEVAAATQEELAQKRNVILSELPRLMELDKAEAVFTVGEAFRGNHKAALRALESTSTLQFEYLDALLRPGHMNPSAAGGHDPSQDRGPSGAASGVAANAGAREGNRTWSGTSGQASTPALKSMPALASALDDEDRSLHVRLLIKFRPYEVYSFLSNSTGYSLDDTLALCQERGVADATAYLLERKGDVTGALSLALRTLSSRLSSLRSALQSANLRDIAAEMAFVSPSSPSKRTAAEAWSTTPQGSGWGHVPWSAGGGIAGGSAGSSLVGAGPRAGTAAWARWASKVALEGLQEGRETTRSLTVAIEMCQRASPPAGGGATGSSRAAASRSGAAASSPVPGRSAVGEARGRMHSTSAASAGATEDVDDGDLDLSASLLFQTLDKILSAKGAETRAAGSVAESGGSATGMAVAGGDIASSSGLGKVKRGRQVAGELPQTAALMQGVLDALLQRTLSSMAGYVPLPVIVKKVVSDHAGSSLGEFRHVILAMLDTYSYDTAIHRTATTLMFDSLRNAVREQHLLKGAGVRVYAVGAHKLPRMRLDRLTPGAAGVGTSTHGESPRGETGSFVAKGAIGVEERALPVSKTPPSALLEAVGSGVISVSRGGVARVEHLGRASLGEGTEGAGASVSGAGHGDKVGEVDLSGTAPVAVAVAGASTRGAVAVSGKYESQASLWRLRAARRRRQARGDKMRSLVTWATEEHPAVLGVAEEPASRRARRGVAGGLFSRVKGATREGALGEGGAAAPSGAVGRSGGREREQGGLEQGGQAVGWSVKLQARALAIPASFLPKRT